MLRIITCLAVYLFAVNAFSSPPDTLIIKTLKHKGMGPFHFGVSPLSTMEKDDPWRSTVPNMVGIPDTLDRLMFATVQVDFFQFTYQNFYLGNINKEWFSELQKSWAWYPDSTNYTKDFVKVSIGIAAGVNKNNDIVVIVDQNNNYDLSDDLPYIIPPKLPGQNFWGRYHDDLPIKVEYEYFDGESKKKDKTWLYVDYDVFTYSLPDSSLKQNQPVKLSYAFTEYRSGTVTNDGQEYKIFVRSLRPVYRNQTKLKVQLGKDKHGIPKYSESIKLGERIRLGNDFYIFHKVLKGGKYIVLLRESEDLKGYNSQVGFLAPIFSAISLTGEKINLDELKGKYVVLDFWGTWCKPCRDEIPMLKNIYKKYAGKHFEIIGIANDSKNRLSQFVSDNGIQWPQILQENSKQILNLYQITSYPTIFLIDPNGKIIEKNIRSELLAEKLARLFNEK